jgi:AcrR family transcriptional regulator
MADADPTTPPGRRELKKDEARTRITDAMAELLAEGRIDISHDLIAERTGISRRTIYRYFPDKEALFDSVMSRIHVMLGQNVTMAQTEEDLTSMLHDIYTGFDRIAPIATLVRSTPQGRALRLAANKRRVAGYTAAAADAVKTLPEEDQKLATAMLQVLHTTPWLEMRDMWGLSGDQIARVTGWAMRTLLNDLRLRDGRPLDEDAAPPG